MVYWVVSRDKEMVLRILILRSLAFFSKFSKSIWTFRPSEAYEIWLMCISKSQRKVFEYKNITNFSAFQKLSVFKVKWNFLRLDDGLRVHSRDENLLVLIGNLKMSKLDSLDVCCK